MRVIDLFAGCGGMTLGFVRAGFEPVFAAEIEAAAAATYQTNFEITPAGDATQIKKYPPADIVIGGLPCQGFSQLGSRNPADPRNQMWEHFAGAVTVSGAEKFLIENVPPFLKSPQAAALLRWAENRGYLITAGILNAGDYGAAQNRRRAFVFADKARTPRLPSPQNGETTVSDALRGIPLKPGRGRLPSRAKDGIPGPFQISELHLARRPTLPAAPLPRRLRPRRRPPPFLRKAGF